MGLPTAPENEPMQVDTSLPSKIKVTRKLGIFQTHKTTELVGLSPFFKDGDKIVTLELTKLVESRCESGFAPNCKVILWNAQDYSAKLLAGMHLRWLSRGCKKRTPKMSAFKIRVRSS